MRFKTAWRSPSGNVGQAATTRAKSGSILALVGNWPATGIGEPSEVVSRTADVPLDLPPTEPKVAGSSPARRISKSIKAATSCGLFSYHGWLTFWRHCSLTVANLRPPPYRKPHPSLLLLSFASLARRASRYSKSTRSRNGRGARSRPSR